MVYRNPGPLRLPALALPVAKQRLFISCSSIPPTKPVFTYDPPKTQTLFDFHYQNQTFRRHEC